MEKDSIIFVHSAWWILLIVILAGGLTYFFYSHKNVPWSKNKNLVLSVLRFSTLFLVLLLVLEPAMKTLHNEIEKPIIVLAIDNSESIKNLLDSDALSELTQKVKQLKTHLQSQEDYNTEWMFLEGDSLHFNATQSGYSNFIHRIKTQYRKRNVGAVVLVGDGIYNQGISPDYGVIPFKMHTVGVGTENQVKDVQIDNIRYNEIAFLGNAFPVEIALSSQGYTQDSLTVSILNQEKKILKSKTVSTQSDQQRLSFLITSDSVGVNTFEVQISALEDEISYENNKGTLFIDILKSKKKVLIRAKNPHPDIKSIKTVLESTGNYEVILDIETWDRPLKVENFDVQILMDNSKPLANQKGGIWYFQPQDIGSNPTLFGINPTQLSLAVPSFNDKYSKFTLSNHRDRILEYPPIWASDFSQDYANQVDVLFFQKKGTSNHPLLYTFEINSQKTAVILGRNIWKWKMKEAVKYGNHDVFDEWVQKVVQYLSQNEKKQQFRVDPLENIYDIGEDIVFDIEIYNDIFEPIHAQPYSIKVVGNEGSKTFDFIYAEDNRWATLPSLSPGEYQYFAQTQIGNQEKRVKGKFIVNKSNFELQNLRPNHEILKQIAYKTGGGFYTVSEFEELEKDLLASKVSGVIHSHIQTQPFVHFWWFLTIILVFLFLEWILRKFWGHY